MACNKNKEEVPGVLVQTGSTTAPLGSGALPPVVPVVPVDPAALGRLASEALRAHAAKDGRALVDLVQPSERERATKEILPGGAARDSYFADRTWRMKAVQAWDGNLHEMRIEGRRARIRFTMIEQDRAGVVELIHEDGSWYFRDIKRPPRGDFLRWGRPIQVP
jgi:hypothetical protein